MLLFPTVAAALAALVPLTRALALNGVHFVEERHILQRAEDERCPADHKACPASLGGGCCPDMYECATDHCFVPGEADGCEAGYYACKDTEYCCEIGYTCAGTEQTCLFVTGLHVTYSTALYVLGASSTSTDVVPVPATELHKQPMMTPGGSASSTATGAPSTLPPPSAATLVGAGAAPTSTGLWSGSRAGLKPYVIGGIAAGVVVFLAVVGLAVWIIKRRIDRLMAAMEKRDAETKDQPPAADGTPTSDEDARGLKGAGTHFSTYSAVDTMPHPSPYGAVDTMPHHSPYGGAETAPHYSAYGTPDTMPPPSFYPHGAEGAVSRLSMPGAAHDASPYLSLYSMPEPTQHFPPPHGPAEVSAHPQEPVEMWVPQPGTPQPAPAGPGHAGGTLRQPELSGSFGWQGDAHGVSEMDTGRPDRAEMDTGRPDRDVR